MESVRLLIDAPAAGAVNMARDEALLVGCGCGDGQAVLRFYAWSPATISLGYFQAYAEYERLTGPAGDLAVVRRTTGGGAILHDLEITYSLVLPGDHRLAKGGPVGLYERAHKAIIAAIDCDGVRMFGEDETERGGAAHRGPFFCFDRRHALDIVYDDPTGAGGVAKIAGSAQRRTREAVLQHGSIMLASRHAQQRVGTWSSLAESVTFSQAVDRLLPAFERALGVVLMPDEWREEARTASETLTSKHAGSEWIQRR